MKGLERERTLRSVYLSVMTSWTNVCLSIFLAKEGREGELTDERRGKWRANALENNVSNNRMISR